MKRNGRKGLLACALAGLLALAAGAAGAEVFFERPPAEWKPEKLLQWTVFDTNEGDAMLLECGGESMMVDGGPKPFREPLRDALEARGLRHMKYLLSTHNHDDHIDGLYYLLTYGFTADEYLHSYSDIGIAQNERAKRTVKEAQKHGVPVRRVESGEKLTLGEAELQVFYSTTLSGTNARSVMTKVNFGDSSLLLCADIVGNTQRYFLESLPAETLKADLIKLPHHDITPVVPEFLDAVDPKGAVATNRIKDVDTRSVAQLKSRGLTTLFSGDGTVYAVTDGRDWYLYQTPGEF